MSKTSYFLLGVIAIALMYMGAVRLQEWYTQHKEAQEIAAQNDGELFRFQQIPVSLAAPEVELMQNPVKYQRAHTEIYLEDTPLTQEQQVKQAQDTIESIVRDFEQEPALAEFNQDLQTASQGTVQNLTDLSTQNLQQILQQTPEINGVVQKYAKNPDFAKIMEEIFSNPQFQQSVIKLQGEPGTAQKPAAQ